jgi:hypothetical protein
MNKEDFNFRCNGELFPYSEIMNKRSFQTVENNKNKKGGFKILKKPIYLILPCLFVLFAIAFTATGCVKQHGCKDYDNYRREVLHSEGTLVILKEPYHNEHPKETYYARFFSDPFDYNSIGMGVVGGLPNKYKKMDTVHVRIIYTLPSGPTNVVYGMRIKCIEQID